MLAVETTLRRDLSMKTKEAFMQVGMVLILILFVIVMYHDIVRLLPHH
jgi:membrane-associated protease RseP (regulator of RpoE activity)